MKLSFANYFHHSIKTILASWNAIQCAEDTEHHKPDPLVFTPLKEKLAKRGITPEQVMYIGDSASDYFAARDAGFAFTGFKPSNSRINPFGQFQVPIVSDLRLLAVAYLNRSEP